MRRRTQVLAGALATAIVLLPLALTNTLTGRKEALAPRTPGHIRVYWCGVTVYSRAHVGHARFLITADLLVRYLRARGFDVVVVETDPLPLVEPGRSELEGLAYRLWLLERETIRSRLEGLGIGVARYRDTAEAMPRVQVNGHNAALSPHSSFFGALAELEMRLAELELAVGAPLDRNALTAEVRP